MKCERKGCGSYHDECEKYREFKQSKEEQQEIARLNSEKHRPHKYGQRSTKKYLNAIRNKKYKNIRRNCFVYTGILVWSIGDSVRRSSSIYSHSYLFKYQG